MTNEIRVLLHKNGTPVKVGDTVTSFRGETATVTGWPNDGYNRVYVKWNEGANAMSSSYFPTVFNLAWADYYERSA